MQHLKVSGAIRPLKWSLGVKWLNGLDEICTRTVHRSTQRLHSLFTLLPSSTHWHLHSAFRSVCTLPVFSLRMKVSWRGGQCA